MNCIEVIITDITDTEGYPHWVECEMIDIHGTKHIFKDKMPVFSARDIERGELPTTGILRCSIIENSGKVARIDTSTPDDVESICGKSIFEVFTGQVKK